MPLSTPRLRRSALRSCLVIAALAISGLPAQAVQIGAWDVTAQSAGGRFHHCLMLSDSDPEVKIGFAKAPGRFSIIFSHVDFDPRKGQRFNVQVSSGSETRKTHAVATEDGVAMIDLHGDNAFNQDVSDTGSLVIRLPRRTLRITLPAGHFEAFGKLEQCAEQGGR